MEDDGFEDEEFGPPPPGVARQARLERALLEKGDAVPVVLHRDLRQQQAPLAVPLDHETVGPDLDVARVPDLPEGRQDRDLEAQVLELGGAVVKLISSPAIQFKGTGWYITDYAKKSSPTAERKSEAKGGPKAGPKAGPGEAAKKKPEKADTSGS